METIGKIISAGIITGAVFILFLYSPVASPELYETNNQMNTMIHPSIYLESKITKLPKSRKNSMHHSAELQITNSLAESPKTFIQKEAKEFNPFGDNSENIKNIYTTSRSNIRHTGGHIILSNGNSVSSSGKIIANNIQGHGFMALRTNGDVNNPALSAAVTDETTGNTSPGDQPTGDVLPLSDGLIIMLLMSVGFAGWKKVRIRKGVEK